MSVWKKVKIKDIAILDNGINFNKSAYASGIKIIGVSDFKDRFSPDSSTLQEVKEEIVRSEDYLQPGDILFVRSMGIGIWLDVVCLLIKIFCQLSQDFV